MTLEYSLIITPKSKREAKTFYQYATSKDFFEDLRKHSQRKNTKLFPQHKGNLIRKEVKNTQHFNHIIFLAKSATLINAKSVIQNIQEALK